jgi:beta-N-acetylglucosaminidase
VNQLKVPYEIIGEKRQEPKGRELMFKGCIGFVVAAFVVSSCTSNLEKNMNEEKQFKERVEKRATQELVVQYQKVQEDLERTKTTRGTEETKPEILTQTKVTAEQLNEYFQKNAPNFKGLGYAFKGAETEAGVNAVYLASIAGHESGWGTNQCTTKKNNIMSICAYDWNPVGAATNYKTKGQCVYDGALLLKRDYLNPKGKYFNGTSLEGINKKYATDKGWAGKVKRIVDQIERGV